MNVNEYVCIDMRRLPELTTEKQTDDRKWDNGNLSHTIN
jgi:hypothetical protein